MDKKEKAIKIYDSMKSGERELAIKLLKSDESLLDFVTPFGTWLHIAAQIGDIELMKFLVDVGMDINANEGVPKSAPLDHASGEGYLNIVEFLFTKGAKLDVSAPDRNPLFSAILGGHLNIVKFLVSKGIDITVKYTGDTMKDMGAYEFAVERGQLEIAEYLKAKL